MYNFPHSLDGHFGADFLKKMKKSFAEECADAIYYRFEILHNGFPLKKEIITIINTLLKKYDNPV